MVAAFMAAASTAVVGGGSHMHRDIEVLVNSRKERKIMLQRISIYVQPEWSSSVRFAVSILISFLLGSSFAPAFAQQPGQRTFPSAEDAGQAFFSATQAQNETALLNILGPDGKDLIGSGDPDEDLNARVGFVAKYQEMHRFAAEPDGTVALIIGAENWPFPIPLANNHGSWYFDTAAGKDEILFRRIGKNEIAAIDACRALVEAQKEYFARPQNQPPKQFAKKLVSDKGRHNGLYWQDDDNEFASPIDSLIAYANGKGSNHQGGDPIPFNGYLFRVLTSQGSHAPGGAKNYVVEGRMTGGFAFVAYPAEYRSSGVMTLIVNESGTIYEKDLGPNTKGLAQAMTVYDPNSTWHRVE